MGHSASYQLLEVARRHHRFADRVVSALPLTSRALGRTSGRSVARHFVPPLLQAPQSALASAVASESPDHGIAAEGGASTVGDAPASPLGALNSAWERSPDEEALRPTRDDVDDPDTLSKVPAPVASPEPGGAPGGEPGAMSVATPSTHTQHSASAPSSHEREGQFASAQADRSSSGSEALENVGAAEPVESPAREPSPRARAPQGTRRAATKPSASDAQTVRTPEQGHSEVMSGQADQQVMKRVEPYAELAHGRQNRRHAPQTRDQRTDDTQGAQAIANAQDTEQGPPAATLFAPVVSDRSPASWHTRLVESARREAARAQATATSGRAVRGAPGWESSLSAPARQDSIRDDQSPRSGLIAPTNDSAPTVPAIPTPSHDPLPDQTRRFLAPLVGVDPASTRVYHGQSVDTATTAAHADALSMGDEIALSSKFSAEAPERLGLLAHELTHVARSHESQFVPPIVREAPQRRNLPTARTVDETEPSVGEPTDSPDRAPEPITLAETADEESLATLAEARVIELARARTRIVPSSPPHEVRTPRGARPQLPPGQPARPTTWTGRSSDAWGGVPAPWEPLPGWLASPPSETDAPPAETSTEAPSVQRAAIDRTRPEASMLPLDDTPAMEQPAAPEPDLDALAQHVHTILKRRLAVERRREG